MIINPNLQSIHNFKMGLLIVRLKIQGRRVDAKSLAARFRAVRKNVPEMRIPIGAQHFLAKHAVRDSLTTYSTLMNGEIIDQYQASGWLFDLWIP